MVIDTHVHLYTGTPGKKYFPTRQTWHVCMGWAYRDAPYTRDPAALYDRQETRMSDPDGTYTIGNMDDQGVDVSICLPVDYDLNFGEESPVSIEEKHQHLGELQRKYPGRIVAVAGPDPRRGPLGGTRRGSARPLYDRRSRRSRARRLMPSSSKPPPSSIPVAGSGMCSTPPLVISARVA